MDVSNVVSGNGLQHNAGSVSEKKDMVAFMENVEETFKIKIPESAILD